MVGWWAGDGNANDITGNGRNGIPHGVAFPPGEVKQAFGLDGTDDFVEIPTKPELTPTPITVDAWIYVTGNTFYPSIIGKGNVGTSAESFALYLHTNGTTDGDGKASFLVNTLGLPLTRTTAGGPAGMPIAPGGWHFLAGTYDGTNVKVYVDGAPAGAAATVPSSTIHKTLDPLLIGKAERSTSPYPTSYFQGKIDEVELFNRALGASELKAIYDAKTAGKCKCQAKPVKGEGDVKDDDGHNSKMSMVAERECDDSGNTHFEDDSGKVMDGKPDAIMVSGNTAIVSGPGKLQDGTPVRYTTVLQGNQPLIGANLFSISWTTATGSVFHRSGALIDGYIVVPPQ